MVSSRWEGVDIKCVSRVRSLFVGYHLLLQPCRVVGHNENIPIVRQDYPGGVQEMVQSQHPERRLGEAAVVVPDQTTAYARHINDNTVMSHCPTDARNIIDQMTTLKVITPLMLLIFGGAKNAVCV